MNALQMLDVAKATFPHAAYEDVSVSLDCAHPGGTTEELVCGWREVEGALRAGTSHGLRPDEEGSVVETALKVCRRLCF